MGKGSDMSHRLEAISLSGVVGEPIEKLVKYSLEELC
jgi:hypothetical protein